MEYKKVLSNFINRNYIPILLVFITIFIFNFSVFYKSNSILFKEYPGGLISYDTLIFNLEEDKKLLEYLKNGNNIELTDKLVIFNFKNNSKKVYEIKIIDKKLFVDKEILKDLKKLNINYGKSFLPKYVKTNISNSLTFLNVEILENKLLVFMFFIRLYLMPIFTFVLCLELFIDLFGRKKVEINK